MAVASLQNTSLSSLAAQTTVLRFTGFLPLYAYHSPTVQRPRRNLSTYLSTMVAICLITGTIYPITTNFMRAVYVLAFPSVQIDTNTAGLVLLMEKIPYGLISLRAFLVLILFFRKRNTFSTLALDMSMCLPSNRGFAERITVLCSWVGLLVTALFPVAWECFSVLQILITSRNTTLLSRDAYEPLPIPVVFWHHQLSVFLLRCIPFILSQQVYLTAMVLAWMASSELKRIARDIAWETAQYTGLNWC
ncbi:hypothetical protein BV898_17978 [Hypsibius exemplaris]|uniref:Uncharacterized protein n=1 Tax=Hypsibius exemplaris TaxID=2072580 RepID=A0A9X6RN06_HYPEX|nr:hypothetical protein BV898_17978 [Hypsibius exemplaris]